MTLRGGGAHDTLSIFATEAGKDIHSLSTALATKKFLVI